jgi:GTP-binding protein
MLVKDAFLDACEVDIRKYPSDGLFEIVLIGKSNVGKSSFINAMTERKALARTSGAPGKTRTANFYRINNAFYFVICPDTDMRRSQKPRRHRLRRSSELTFADAKAILPFFSFWTAAMRPQRTILRRMRS